MKVPVRSEGSATLLAPNRSRLKKPFLSVSATKGPVSNTPSTLPGARRSEEHTSELQSHRDLHSIPTRRSSDLHPLGAQPIEVEEAFLVGIGNQGTGIEYAEHVARRK